MKVIGIETSGSIGSVAAREGGVSRAERFFTRGLHHGVELIPKLEEVCREMRWAIQEVDLIAVSVGPGSYTGIRIGVATAKALAYAGRMNIVGVSTLHALSENAGRRTSPICTVLDAKRGKVYTCLFSNSSGRKERLWPFSVMKPEEAAERCPEGAFLLGNGLTLYQKTFESFGKHLQFGEEELWQVRASAVARLGEEAFLEGQRSDPLSLTPLYLSGRGALAAEGGKGMT